MPYYSYNPSKRKRLRRLIAFLCLALALALALFGADTLTRIRSPEYRAKQLAERAEVFLELGDTGSAVESLEEALKLEPGHTPRQVLLWQAMTLHGDRDGAEALLRSGLREQPDDVQLKLALGKHLVMTWRPREARDLLVPVIDELRALPSWHGRSEGLCTVGTAYAGCGAMEEALALLEEAGDPLTTTPTEQAAALLIMARVYRSTWRLTEARESLRKASKLVPDSEQIDLELSLVLQQSGHPVEAERRLRALFEGGSRTRLAVARPLGELLVSRGRLEEARAIADDVAARAQIPASYLRAAIAVREGDLAGADRVYEKLGTLDPHMPIPHLLRARLALRQGRTAEARQAYEAALTAAPNLPEAEQGLLTLDQREGNAKAIEERAKALLADPNTRPIAICALVTSAKTDQASAKAGLARLLELQERYPGDGSVRVYATIFKVLADAPLGPGELERVVSEPDLVTDLTLLARAQAGHTDVLEAIELLGTLLAKEPRFSAVRLVLAKLYRRLGRLDLAVREVEAAAASSPSTAASYARAQLALELGDLERTEAELEEIVSREPNVSALSVLAEVRSRQGRVDEGVAALTSACELRSHDARLQGRLARLLALVERDEEALRRFATARRLDPTLSVGHEDGALHLARGRLGEASQALERGLRETQDVRFAAALAATRTLLGEGGKPSIELLKRYRTQEPSVPEALVAHATLLALSGSDPIAAGLSPTRAVPVEVLTAAGTLPRGPPPPNVRLELEAFGLWAMNWQDEARLRMSRAIPGVEVDTLMLWWGVRRLLRQTDAPLRISLLRQLWDRSQSQPDIGLDLALLYHASRDLPRELEVLRSLRKQFAANREVALRLGQALERAGKLKDALAEYSSAARGDPPIAVALNNQACLMGLDPKQRVEAIDLARQAVTQDPREGEFHDTLGWLLHLDGQVAPAVESLSRAASLRPTRPAIRYHLGEALRTQGHLERAKNNLRMALFLGEFPEKQEARATLRRLEEQRGE